MKSSFLSIASSGHYASTNKSSVKRLIAKSISATIVASLLSVISGCGSLAAIISYGPFCPYQGVAADFAAITSWDMIKQTRGVIIPLGIIDMPLSFVTDTLTLTKIEEMDLDSCPREFD